MILIKSYGSLILMGILAFEIVSITIRYLRKIILTKDSAGGGLCLVTLLVLKDYVSKGTSAMRPLGVSLQAVD